MITDKTSKVLLQNRFSKARSDRIPSRTRSSEQVQHGLKSSTFSETVIDESLSGENNSNLILKSKVKYNSMPKDSKQKNNSRTNTKQETNVLFPYKKASDDFSKVNIARSKLEDIVRKVEEPRQPRKGDGSDGYGGSISTFSTKSSPSLKKVHSSSVSSGVDIRNRHKEKKMESNKNRDLNAIVHELDLPIIFSRNSRFNPKLKRLVFDTHITTSSIITQKPEDVHSGNATLSSYSHASSASQSGQLEDDNYVQADEDKPSINSPFDLCWCFGFNLEVPILNLSNDKSSLIVFTNSQYAALYDFHEETMSFMQGHINTISCISASLTGYILATADSGSKAGTSRVIVWDTRPCVLQVIDNAHPHGCQRIGLSSNGEFLVTVSANEIPTCIKVWDWEKNSVQPSASVLIKESLGPVNKLTMKADSKKEFAITFERSVMFAKVTWHIEGSQEEKIIENISDCLFDTFPHIPLKLGVLTDTTFLDGGEAYALSSTSKGYVLMWEDSKYKKKYSKYVRLHMDCITHIQVVDKKVAVATATGKVSFYDFGLKILYFHKLFSEPLVSLSFNLTPQQNAEMKCGEHINCANMWKNEQRKLVDATLKNAPFTVRHYVASTESGVIAYVNASSGIPQNLVFPNKEPFTALDIMPTGKYLCAGTASGRCILFDTDRHKVKVSRQIKVQSNLCQAISYLKYSPSGYSLACAMYTGDIWLLDPLLLTLSFETPLSVNDCCITQVAFTSDSDYLVAIDVSFCVSVYFLDKTPTLIGQYIAHLQPIIEVLVEPTDSGENETRVFTLSQDRSICEFVINRENKTFNYKWNYRVEQTAIPMYTVYYPYPYSSAGSYLGVNNEYKFRLHDCDLVARARRLTNLPRGTIQGPDFGSPINYMKVFETCGNSYLFLKTKHHIGIHLIPIDGNPFRALAYRASPTEITCSKIHPNGRYVFTISEFCTGISMWRINTQAVEDFYKSGGEGLEPFLKVLGEEKEKDIRDFFDLGQFLHQGESPTLVRTLRNSLPICEVANVLQALGCLLTRQDMNDITTEINYTDLENPNYNIEYDAFVRLYFNYRRTHDLKIKDLRQAFRDFYAGVYFNPDSPEILRTVGSDPVFDSESFIMKLLETGEEMSASELYADFSILTGGQPDLPEDIGLRLMSQVPPTMPKEFTFKIFVKDILGFNVPDTVFDKELNSEK